MECCGLGTRKDRSYSSFSFFEISHLQCRTCIAMFTYDRSRNVLMNAGDVQFEGDRADIDEMDDIDTAEPNQTQLKGEDERTREVSASLLGSPRLA